MKRSRWSTSRAVTSSERTPTGARSRWLGAHAEVVSATAERLRRGCVTAARVVLLAVSQAPVDPADGRLAVDLGGRRVGHLVGPGHALERELRFRSGALHIDCDDLAGLQLTEEDLLRQAVLDLPLDRAAERPRAEHL